MRERRLRGDGGAATTELVIVAPIIVSMIMLIIQFGLYFHASTVASAAAQEGAGTAAVLQADDIGTRIEHGEGQATQFVNTMAPELLTELNVHGEPADTGDSVRMTVEAEVVDVFAVPGVDMDLRVEETSENVLEDFQPADEDPVSES